MPLTISIQFPTGRYVAGRWDDKEEPEWPPHPARFCLGLIDSLHRAGNPDDERAALDWLCAQGAPEIAIPADAESFARKIAGFYVPQNPSDLSNGIAHPRKPRAFPEVLLDSDHPAIFFHWPSAEIPQKIHLPLARLLARLPRYGHSSSFCIARIADKVHLKTGWQILTPLDENDDRVIEKALRVPYAGLLEAAESAFDASGRADEIQALIAAAAKRAKPGKSLKPAASPRARHDPPNRWQAYAQPQTDKPHLSAWDHRLLILRQVSGDKLGLCSTLQITAALHAAILITWPDGHAPSWISGHGPRPELGVAGAPLRSSPAHLTFFPLPFVDAVHADGHLLGVAIALPRQEKNSPQEASQRREWQETITHLFDGKETLHLYAPDGSWDIELAPDISFSTRKLALDPARWTRPCRFWETTTPILLDRHPKPDFSKDPEKWMESCREIIRLACNNLGLPVPIAIEPSFHASLQGVPYATKFPAPQRKNMPKRVRVHARLEFPAEIQGPLLLGAGRHRGYGLLLPRSPRENL